MFLSELHFALRWMDIHIHKSGIDFEKEAAKGEAPLHKHGVVSFNQSVIQAAILDRATIYEKVLIIARGSRDAGRANDTPDGSGLGTLYHPVFIYVSILDVRSEIDRDERNIARIKCGETFLQRANPILHRLRARHCRQLPDDPTILHERAGNLRIGERDECEIMLNVRLFRFFTPQKFSARGQVEE